MQYTLRPYQKSASDAAIRAFNKKKARSGIIIEPTGCHEKGYGILMYDGSIKKVEDIVVGDVVMGNDGTPRNVLSLHHGKDMMYKITPRKGEPFVVNGGHILSLVRTNDGTIFDNTLNEISVTDYLSKSKTYKHIHKLHRCEAVKFDKETNVPHPYLLGLYLGDGSSANGSFSITTQRKEVEEYLCDLAITNGYSIRFREKSLPNKARSLYLTCNGTRANHNGLHEWLRHYGLFKVVCGDKFIPDEYKTASYADRLELLAGLLDTDAYYSVSRKNYEYCTKSKTLAKDVQFLSRSLGFFCQIGKKVVNETTYYSLYITGNISNIPVRVKIREGEDRQQKKSIYSTGFDVEEIGNGEYYGFTLDGNHLYVDWQYIVHHNSGKSVIIADIVSRIKDHILIFCPNKEILEQNHAKLMSYGIVDCGIYSASVSTKKVVNRVTFATIGSVIRHLDEFKHFKMVLIDECHFVNADAGMYKRFIEDVDRVVIGFTATPYRLTARGDGFSELKFITRTRPRIFSYVYDYTQVSDLVAKGFLAKLNYYDITSVDMRRVQSNSTGADYSDESLLLEYDRVDFYGNLVSTIKRLLKPKSGIPRKGILVFTRFVKEAERVCNDIPCAEIVHGELTKKERERVINGFRSGEIKVLVNVGVLTVGFDYPELDTILMARPTKSLALWYQIVGRVIRPYPNKVGWVVDMCGTYRKFGKVEDLKVTDLGHGKWCITSNGRQLTNVPM